MRSRLVQFFASCALSSAALCASAADPINSARELASAIANNASDGRAFVLDATVSLACAAESKSFPVFDNTGAVFIRKENFCLTDFQADAGDTLHITGVLCRNSPNGYLYAGMRTVRKTGRARAPVIPEVGPADLATGAYDFHPVRIRGQLRDVQQDEIDPDFIFLILRWRNTFLPVPIPSHWTLAANAAKCIGADIELTGICSPRHLSSRQQIGRHAYAIKESDVLVLRSPENDDYSVPDVERLAHCSPDEILRQDKHRATGSVVAVLHRNRIVVRTRSGRLVGATLCGDCRPPRYGQSVEVVGFPECTLYNINLSRANWRPERQGSCTMHERTACLSADDMLSDASGRSCFIPSAHGSVARVHGIVRNLPAQGNDDGLLNIECGRFIVPVDASSVPDALAGIAVGCEVEVTGTCVMESENWRPNLIFPKITRAIIVPRYASDIRILSRPSWWTPSRLLAVIGALFLSLVGILVWNASLRVLAQRRGRELFKSQIAKVSSELRVSERTRLAVELHDSITQNLTGVTLQLDAASNARAENPAEADAMLGIARRSLQSCLDELRRCLWDLRSEALEEPDFNQAIRIALKQVSANADVAVRFNIRRNRLSDATAHAILRIIRELVSNAMRHGRATKIRIAGEMLADHIHFAVTDNGCGFETATAPGPGEGHFGLSGIRERLKDLHGTLLLSSSDKGTRAEISIDLPAAPAP